MSPLGGSTLITSAPKSDRITAALGPAMKLAKSTTFSPEKILSFMACLVRWSKGRVKAGAPWSQPLKVRFALFAERGHALFHVLGSGTGAKQGRLDLQAIRQSGVEATVHGVDGQLDRHRGVGMDLVQYGFRPGDEIGAWNDLVDQADPIGLLGAD